MYVYICIYRVSQEERAKLREGVSYVKLYRYNPKHLYAKLNGCGDNGQRKVWTSCISAFYTPTAVSRATPRNWSCDCVQCVRWLVLRRTSPAQRDKTVLHCCQICKCLVTLKTTAGISARVFVVQFNGFMPLTSYFDVKYRY